VTGDWTNVFLGVIAAATLTMALIQVGALIALARVARQAQQTVSTVNQEIRPLVAKASAIADEASRTAVLATAQAQKVDVLVSDLARRVEDTAAVVQQAIVVPAREGLAIVSAIKAGLGVFRGAGDPRQRPPRHEEEDTLFIG
jgi:hypothetical protein